MGKKLKTFYHFSRFYLHFLDFFQFWKIAGQISRLFQEFKRLPLYYLPLQITTLCSRRSEVFV